jgi:hypothetical protein
MTPDQLKDLHAAVYRNTGQDPMWLGYWLKQFSQSEDLSWDDVAQELGISNEELVLVCLCRTPRADHFQEDIGVVCRRTGAREDQLARIVRQEQAMARWRANTPSTSTGWFLAASDRQDLPESIPEAESDDDEN